MSFKNLKIAHTSDLHFRSLSRHDEVKSVFTQFAQQCKDMNVDHIFVGGDIYHTKTSGISPEYIDLMTWWLKTLSMVAPLHLTLGNHDGNLSNSTRQDAISPIVDAVNLGNVYLYKNSGTYNFDVGYNWCVFSLFDKENWKNVKPVTGEINIACYHGPVAGAVTETNWELTDGIDLEFFAPYDMVMLGDIHSRQYLDYKKREILIDESELKLYPGAEIINE